MSDIIDKIKSRGYWKVVIRPTDYVEDRLDRSECRQTVLSHRVTFRGWDYPHTRRGEISNGENFVEHTTDWEQFVEWWRLYQSGQFVHLFGIHEDWAERGGMGRTWVDADPGDVLRVLHALYQITEIFEFASRLASTKVLEDEAHLEITLTGLDGRTLTMQPGRMLRRGYTCEVDELPKAYTLSTEKLLGQSAELALKHAKWLFEGFNWHNVPLDVFREDQRKLIEGRL